MGQPHSPLEQLFALVEVVVLITHEIQHSPGRLLLKGAALAAHAQPAKGGDESSPTQAGMGQQQDPPQTYPRSLSKSLGRYGM